MLKNLTLVFGCLMGLLTHSASAQTYFSQDFSNVTGAYPTGWTRHNLDGLTPNAGVGIFNFGTNAWVCRALSGDSALISTSWYTPVGIANDWAFTPAITIPAAGTNTRLYWNGLALEADFRDGYEVYIRTTAPTNLNVASSTLLLTVPAEDSFWQARNLSLAAYAGQTVYIGFRNNSNDMAALAIDDVVVANTITPAPANDNCSGAIALTVGATCSAVLGSVVGTTASGVAACAGTAEDDVWYRFVATSSGATVRVQGSADFDAVFRVYSGVCGTPTPIGTCTDATGIGAEEVATVTGLTAGQTYYIQLFDYDNALPPTTNFAICVENAATPPANDNCTGAISLTHGTTCTPISGTTQSATSSGMTNTCGGDSEDDVWYSFVATSPRAIIGVAGAANFDAVVEVYTGTCASLTALDCEDNLGIAGVESITYASLTVGQTYYVRVYDFEPTASSTPTFNICVSSYNACSITIPAGTTPENEACAASANNGCSVTPTAFQSITCGQTISGTTWANNGTRDLDFYRFTVTTADTVFFDLVSEAPVNFLLGTTVCPFTVTGNASLQACQSGSFAVYMTPGTYYAVVGHQSFNGWACSANANDYVFGLRFKTTPLANTATVNGTCANGAGAGALALGGFAPFTYLWSNGATTSNISGLMASGNYTVTVTNSNTCKTTATASVSYTSTTITASNVINPAICASATGSINITPTNGTSPYMFMWSNSRTTQNVTGLVAGSYSVTITDANGCTGVLTGLNVAGTPTTLTASNVINPAICASAIGSININPSNGTAPYMFMWSNSRTTQNVTGLTAGTYSVTITDANGCTGVVTGLNVTTTSTTLTANNVVNPTTCGGATGSINITPSNGTAPYMFMWSNSRTTQNVTGLAAGTYSVTITDANGCTGVITGLNVTGANPPLVNATTSAATCTGANGSVSLSISGGVTPYMFMWSNGRTTQNINGVVTGAYSVTVTDVNGCTATSAATVAQNSVVISANASASAASCGNAVGSISLVLNNGTAPYMFMWSNGRTIQNIASLAAGSYSVTITDANGCTGSVANINVSSTSAPTANASALPATCTALNGSVSLAVAGGVTPYMFMWSNGRTTQNINGVAAGAYSVTVTDANGCTVAASATVTNNGVNISASASTTQTGCTTPTGTANLTLNNGTAPYMFMWSNGRTTQNLAALSAGSYSVTITDANGCTGSVANVNITSAGGPTVGVTSTDVSCPSGTNGTITLSPTGGATPYTIVWSIGNVGQLTATGLAANTYTATVTDANNCAFSISRIINQPSPISVTLNNSNIACNGQTNGFVNLSATGGTGAYTFRWSNGALTQNISNLGVGSYTATVTDANACSVTSSAANISQPTVLNVPNTINQITCNGTANGLVTLNPAGGTTPYTFLWSNGATTSALSGLGVGTYSATVSDANNCRSSSTYTITQPTVLSVLSSSSNVLCNGGASGAINLNVSGGTAPYGFMWSNGASVANPSGLSAGVYTGTVTDAQGCSSNAAFTLTQPSALSVSISSAAANCLPNGSTTLTIGGGTPAYMFMWSNGATIQNLSGLAGGTYTATITDANLCASVATTTVTNIGSTINVSNTVTQPTTANNGAVAISVTGGVAPYTFAWSNGRTTQNISGVGAGSYAVTVTDANGCLVTTNVQLSLPVSVQEANNNQTIGVELFPNPSTGLATLRINTNNQQAELSIQVFSSTGQQLVSYQAQTNDVFAQELNLDAFADGLYFVRVQANNTVSTHKLLIAR